MAVTMINQSYCDRSKGERLIDLLIRYTFQTRSSEKKGGGQKRERSAFSNGVLSAWFLRLFPETVTWHNASKTKRREPCVAHVGNEYVEKLHVS